MLTHGYLPLCVLWLLWKFFPGSCYELLRIMLLNFPLVWTKNCLYGCTKRLIIFVFCLGTATNFSPFPENCSGELEGDGGAQTWHHVWGVLPSFVRKSDRNWEEKFLVNVVCILIRCFVLSLDTEAFLCVYWTPGWDEGDLIYLPLTSGRPNRGINIPRIRL